MNPQEKGLAGRIAEAFIDSKLTPLIIVASILIRARRSRRSSFQ